MRDCKDFWASVNFYALSGSDHVYTSFTETEYEQQRMRAFVNRMGH
jgi:hypothetical protein